MSGTLPSLVLPPKNQEIPAEMSISTPPSEITWIPSWILKNFEDVLPGTLTLDTLETYFQAFFDSITSLEQLYVPPPADVLTTLGKTTIKEQLNSLCDFLVV